MDLATAERLLDSHRLQVLGRNGWYDIRRNGATKRWKRDPHRAEIPVKLGLRECFRLEYHAAKGEFGQSLRERPENFDGRTRWRLADCVKT